MGRFIAEADLLRLDANMRLSPLAEANSHPGKILADSATVESYKIEEKGFIVCMVNKVGLLLNGHKDRTDSDSAKSSSSCEGRPSSYTTGCLEFNTSATSRSSTVYHHTRRVEQSSRHPFASSVSPGTDRSAASARIRRFVYNARGQP